MDGTSKAIREIAEEANAAGCPIDEAALKRFVSPDKTMREVEDDMEEMTIEEAFKVTKKGKTRAGFTTNKGHGTSKARRKMASKSRKINRK